MSARIIDGKAFAANLRSRVGAIADDFAKTAGRPAGLAVVLVGEDPASSVYVRAKERASAAANIGGAVHRLPAATTQDELLALVGALNTDAGVDGILVQLPLPPHIDSHAIIAAIDPDKDVDGFHPINAGRLASGLPGFVPCTPLGSLMLLKDVHEHLAGLEAVVVGRSNIVGKPMAQLLLAESCTVTVAHSRTRDLFAAVRRSDIVIAAVGVPELIRGEWIKPGATIIDVGINRVTNPYGTTRLIGDVAYDEALDVAGAITPVPGGVGPMTIAVLLRNTLVAAHRNAGIALDETKL